MALEVDGGLAGPHCQLRLRSLAVLTITVSNAEPVLEDVWRRVEDRLVAVPAVALSLGYAQDVSFAVE